MDETEYIMSSPKMVEILREGEKEIAEGNFETIAIDSWSASPKLSGCPPLLVTLSPHKVSGHPHRRCPY